VQKKYASLWRLGTRTAALAITSLGIGIGSGVTVGSGFTIGSGIGSVIGIGSGSVIAIGSGTLGSVTIGFSSGSGSGIGGGAVGLAPVGVLLGLPLLLLPPFIIHKKQSKHMNTIYKTSEVQRNQIYKSLPTLIRSMDLFQINHSASQTPIIIKKTQEHVCVIIFERIHNATNSIKKLGPSQYA
jgi:hypothetical protein